MRSFRERAVIATAFSTEADGLAALLRGAGFSEILTAQDGLRALELVRQTRPDALLADAVLPLLDGTELIARICAEPLTVYPAAILLTLPGMNAGWQRLEGCCAALQKPVGPRELEEALERLAPERRVVPESKRRRAESILTALGVPEHPGRDYLLRAVLIAWQDARCLSALTTRLYPTVASLAGTNARHVERAMRHAIDVAWRSGDMEAQYRIFGDTIDAKRGNPTCGEMIARIADILRWEGKA